MQRRSFLQSASALSLLGLGACASVGTIPSKARVLVVGGGYGGATAAKYIRLLSDSKIDVVLVEPNASFVSCPISNLVLGGSKTLEDVTRSYDGLTKAHGIRVVKDFVVSVDTAKKVAVLASGPTIAYDKLVLSPGIDLMWDSVAGLRQANTDGKILQAWKAGSETVALRRQVEAMPDGGVYAITIPEAPYRCPPGPYERACQVGSYFKVAKPKSKVLILDANADVTSKPGLFKKVWADQYAGMVEYRPKHKAPTQRAGSLAVQMGLANSNARWVGVNYLNFESTAAKDVHVLGDSIQTAPLMPKSGHMANGHAKVAAAAIVAELSGWEINPQPLLTNTCYSFVDAANVIHVASVHEYVAAEKTFKTVAGSGGVSTAPNTLEATYAWNWARTIWADSLA
jgi:sulfide dehydrogenase [flavocytochrome c] flavoprotein chain